MNETDKETSNSEPMKNSKKSVLKIFWISIAVILMLSLSLGAYLVFGQGYRVRELAVALRTTSVEAATMARVRMALALSQRVSAFDIEVYVVNDTVILSGEVPSENIKELAGAITEDTGGVHRVENYLKVDPSARPDPELRQLKQRVADLEIRIILNDAFKTNPALSADEIDVEVVNQEVTLGGSVAAPTNKYLVEGLARSIEGVVSVDNRIEIMEPVAQDTSDLTARSRIEQVEYKLYATGSFDMDTLKVRDKEGALLLEGQVRSQAEKLLAEKIALEVTGVDRVANSLIIKSESPGQ
jgi:osmotically-inducible protein OsmY